MSPPNLKLQNKLQNISHIMHVYVYAVSSSSMAQQPVLSQGLPQKLLPAVPIPCNIPPISLPQLPGIFSIRQELGQIYKI